MSDYEIHLKGRLEGDHWSQWFGGLTVTLGNDETILRGPVTDQAALFGVLNVIRDLGLTLITLYQINT